MRSKLRRIDGSHVGKKSLEAIAPAIATLAVRAIVSALRAAAALARARAQTGCGNRPLLAAVALTLPSHFAQPCVGALDNRPAAKFPIC